MKTHLDEDLFIPIVIILQLLQENQVLQFQQLLRFFHPLLQLEQPHQAVVQLCPQAHHHQQLQVLPPLPHLVAVDLAMVADINDRYLNTKSRNQSGN